MRLGCSLFGVVLVLCSQAQSFTLTSCPASSGVIKAEFNARHGATPTHDAYVQVLRRTFTGDKGGRYVHYTAQQANGKQEDFYFSIPRGRSFPADLVSLASKGVQSSTVESKSELRALLHDTIALWDTLRVRMRLLDADLAPTGYYLLWTDARDGLPYKSPLPARGDTLYMDARLFGTYEPTYAGVRLRHTSLRKQDLATFTLHLLSAAEKSELLDAVCQRHAAHALSDMERQRLLHQYCTAEHGSLLREQVPVPSCTPSAR